MKKKLLYMGSWGRGFSCIRELYNREDVGIRAVFTQHLPQTNDAYYNLVHDYAVERGIPVFNISGKNSVTVNAMIADYIDQLDAREHIGLSVAFEKIFKRSLLSRLKIINLHPSLLPKYRGPSPELWAVKNNEKYIGITLHWVDEGIDSGNILYQDKFELDYDMTFIEFIDWLNAQSAKVLNDFFDSEDHFKNRGRQQDERPLYFNKLSKKEGFYQKKLSEISDILNHRNLSIK